MASCSGPAGLTEGLKDRVGDLGWLLAALREVATGGSVIDPPVVEAVVARRALSLSESPMEKHVNAIFAKLGLPPSRWCTAGSPPSHLLRDAGLHPPN